MNKEKQIEEMARDICENYNADGTCYCDGKPCDLKCECFTDAQYLYEKGYRKQSEGCGFCKEGDEKCVTCARFFDYYADGGSDRCYTTYRSEKCVFYKPVAHCPKCGAKMRKEY